MTAGGWIDSGMAEIHLRVWAVVRVTHRITF